MPVPRVLWKWTRTGRSPTASRTRPTISDTCAGTPTPIVSASAISRGRASAARFAISTTRWVATLPSNGQPNAVAMVICPLRPAPRASATISIAAASDSSELCP